MHLKPVAVARTRGRELKRKIFTTSKIFCDVARTRGRELKRFGRYLDDAREGRPHTRA